VLHHLPEPALGLKAIGEVLAPQGVVSMMLYGKYGRIGINMLQEALGNIFSADEPMEDRIKMAMELARVVPANHPMAQRRKGRELQEGKDSGIVDLLLHANDIPFDVPLIYRMCREAGMRFYRWLFPQIYKPENYFKGPVFNGALDALQVHEKHEIAELVHGCNGKHSFFAVGPDFNAPDTGLSNGNWRNLHACLTPCLSWNRTMPAPGKKDCFIIPPAVVQDAWDPLVLKKWELLFLGQVVPEKSLGKLAWEPAIRKLMPFNSRKTADLAVEELLEKVLDQMGIVLLEQ
ncbi:MAG: hypothetical protein GY757_03790, partial [bacterium]|nr:hypothetical protein [bacterium]